ncbi:MAG TPA: MFS transporter [Candidatus Limnocylindrales bacterium]|nr:MFS transporter [Candidatus Limnocylindrales bacterium]
MRHVRAALRSPAIRRVVVAFAAFNFAEWATWVAVLVYAFERGGATESGVVAFAMLVPAAVAAPIVASVLGRFRRERALLIAYLTQAVVMAAAAFAFFADAPPLVIYPLATLTSMSVTLARPAHGAILPSLARTPAELTAANVASGTVQNMSIAVAPIVAGIILTASGAGAVFVVCAAGVAFGAALVASVRTEPDAEAEPSNDAPATEEVFAGLRFLAHSPNSRTVVVLIAAAAFIEGALDVLVMVVAIDLVGAGPTEVGALTSAAGLGGIVGAAAAVTLVGRARLAGPFALGLLTWGIPVAVLGVVPGMVTGLMAFLVAGVGRGALDVAGRTLLQRVTPDAALSGVFGVLEGAYMGTIAIGSIAVPAIMALAGPSTTLVVVGLMVPLIVAISWRSLGVADAAAVVHVHELELLRDDPLFEPLAPPTIERLSANLVPVRAASGAWIIREGEVGDRFYVVDEGEVEVSVGGDVVRRQGAGSSFGEIALLRNVPRTASVRAATDVVLLALERDVFLAAVAGHARSRRAADAVVAERMGSG